MGSVSSRQSTGVIALPLVDDQGKLRIALTPSIPRL